MLSAKHEWLTCTQRWRRKARPGTEASSKTALLMSSPKVEAGDLSGWPKHRSSCSSVEEDLVAATSVDRSGLSTIDALRRYDAISKAPRSGYRGSDFVRWHRAVAFYVAAIPSAL